MDGKLTTATCWTDILKQKRYRKALSKIMRKKGRCDSLSRSLREEPRFCYPYEDGETVIEYGFLPGDNNYTEEDLKEIIDDMWMEINSPYDCTGKWFSISIRFKKTPVGIAYVHKKGMDV